MKILFLDIDGVLNSRQFILSMPHPHKLDDQIDPEAVKRLNHITDTTGAEIVISSSWRIIWEEKIDELKLHLKKFGVTGNIFDVTPILSTMRGLEIQSWLNDWKGIVTDFVIIDDDSDMEHLMPYLVKTSFEDGMQDKHMRACIEALGTKVA